MEAPATKTAPAKVAKKTTPAAKKTAKKTPVKTPAAAAGTGTAPAKKKRKINNWSYKTYIHKVLKQVHPELNISKKGMSVMDSFMADIFEQLATESGKLSKINKQQTMSARDVQSAVRLLLNGELSKHAVSEGTKAVSKFQVQSGGSGGL